MDINDDYNLSHKQCKFQYEDHLIGIKKESEHGIEICFYTHKGILNTKFFFRINDGPEYFLYTYNDYYITTFFHNGIGLNEKFYSNRQEYYINGKYYSSEFSDEIQKLIMDLNTKFDINDFSKDIYTFMKSDDKLFLIKKDKMDFKMSNIDIYTCNKCKTFIDVVNTCDFCDNKYCDLCDSDPIFFGNCDKCSLKWCYYDDAYGNLRHHVSKKFPSERCNNCGF